MTPPPLVDIDAVDFAYGKRAIIKVDSDQSPGKYFLYDDAKQSVSLIAERAARQVSGA